LPVARFQPLSQRENPDPAFEAPREGIPPSVWAPVARWLQAVALDGETPLFAARDARTNWMLRLQPALDFVLDWSSGDETAWASLLQMMASNAVVALDVIDFALHDLGEIDATTPTESQQVVEIAELLTSGRSAWRVAVSDEGRAGLLRRFVGPVEESLEDVRSASERAHHHLADARDKTFGTKPSPTAAWASAIRAVEAVAGPVVTPNDPRPQLWRIVPAINDKPSKWTYPLGGPEIVAAMAAALATTDQRHGTDDETVPLEATRDQAAAAYHLALALVQIFASGLFSPA
jgi:hypothetical protein